MNPVVLTRIAVKVVAIYLIAQGLMQVPNVAAAVQFSEAQINWNSQILPVLVVAAITPLVFGIVLWIASNKLSDVILRGVDSTEISSVSSNEIQAILISTIGLLILVLAIPQLTSLCIQLVATTKPVDSGSGLNVFLLSYLVAEIVKIIFGLSLILRVSGWMKMLRKLRGLGLQ